MKSTSESDEVNSRLKNLINSKIRIITDKKVDFDKLLIQNLGIEKNGLDIGKGLRDKYALVSEKLNKIETLDINQFNDYPDIRMDLCSKNTNNLEKNYDVIFCFSILEHCYNPFQACLNMESMLKKNGKIFGYVPFLFQFHCPDDLSYQDYFRFTAHSLIVLFPNAKNIQIFPSRGKIGTTLNILSSKYKYKFEKHFKFISKVINNIRIKKNPMQTSGFNFIVNYD